MSEINTVKSNGTLKLIDGKKYRGYLQADETGAAFYPKGKTEPVVQWTYPRMHRMDRIRRGGTSGEITVILKDDSRYVFDLDYGLKLYVRLVLAVPQTLGELACDLMVSCQSSSGKGRYKTY